MLNNRQASILLDFSNGFDFLPKTQARQPNSGIYGFHGAMPMNIVAKSFSVKTKGDTDIIDITTQVGNSLKEARLTSGILTVFVPGSTAGITTTEYEPGLLQDLPAFYEKIIPKRADYKHNLTWGDGNGYAHVRAALVKSFFTVPFVNSEMILGTWQQIILIDFDNRRRHREVVVQIIGE